MITHIFIFLGVASMYPYMVLFRSKCKIMYVYIRIVYNCLQILHIEPVDSRGLTISTFWPHDFQRFFNVSCILFGLESPWRFLGIFADAQDVHQQLVDKDEEIDELKAFLLNTPCCILTPIDLWSQYIIYQ